MVLLIFVENIIVHFVRGIEFKNYKLILRIINIVIHIVLLIVKKFKKKKTTNDRFIVYLLHMINARIYLKYEGSLKYNTLIYSVLKYSFTRFDMKKKKKKNARCSLYLLVFLNGRI